MADRIRKYNSQARTAAGAREVHAVITTGNQVPANAALGGIAVSPNGTLYVADFVNDVVYKVLEDGTVRGALVGKLGVAADVDATGMLGSDGNTARLDTPLRLCVDASDNIFLVDSLNQKVKRISSSGRCVTLAGDGTAGDVVGINSVPVANVGTSCKFRFLSASGICVDKSGIVYVADTDNQKIKKILPGGVVVFLAGSTAGMADGLGSAARFDHPCGICVDNTGMLYVTDWYNYRIRKVNQNGQVSTLTGGVNGFLDGLGVSVPGSVKAQIGATFEICMDPSNNFMWILDKGNGAVRKVYVDGRVVTFSDRTSPTNSNADAIAVDRQGWVYVLERNV